MKFSRTYIFQIQKHTSIKSANQLPNNQLKHHSSSNQSNRLSNGMPNGSTPHNRQQHVPIYAKKQPVYQQQHLSVAPPPTLSPSSQPKLQENGTKVVKFATTKTQSAPLPIENHTATSDGFIANVTIAASMNNGNAMHSIQSIASSLPPHKQQQHQSTAGKKQNNLNHSSSTNSPTAASAQKPATPNVSSSLFAPIQSVNRSKSKSLGENYNAPLLHRSTSTSSPDSESSKSNNHRLHSNNSYAIDETTQRNAVVAESTISTSIKNEFNDLLSHPTPIRPTNGVGKGKKQTKAASNANAFAKPKAEPKQSIGKKLSLSGKAQPSNGKRKRSYSQTSHHEALQRIPSRQQPQSSQQQQQNGVDTKKQEQLVTKVKREWHAPELISFDFKSPYDVNHDEYEVGSCSQAFWFRDIPNENLLTREQRLEMKRDNLRRQATQYAQAQTFRNRRLAKLRLLSVTNALNKFKNERNK